MTDAANEKSADRRSLALLILGGCMGGLLGCLSATGWFSQDRIPPGVAASVNGADIQMAQYQRALRLFGSEKREPISDRDRSLVLERMIEEELLLQHGVNSGLVRSNSRVREEVLKSILTGLMAELEAGGQAVQDEVYAGEMVGEASSKIPENPSDKTYDTRLVDYLGQLKATSTIRRIDAGFR